MSEENRPSRRAWYRGLLESTPSTPDHAELRTMLSQLSLCAVDDEPLRPRRA